MRVEIPIIVLGYKTMLAISTTKLNFAPEIFSQLRL